MAEIDLKEWITLEPVETDTASQSECGSGACGCGCGSAQVGSDHVLAVVAEGSSEACCEPGCSPETCGGTA